LALRWTGVVDREDEAAGVWKKRSLLWLFRVLTGGLGFVTAVFLVGRVAEAIAVGTGAATATAFGIGTLALPLAATVFEHVLAAAVGFAAFAAGWCAARTARPRDSLWAVSGLCAGLAVLIEYQAVVIGAVLLVYAAGHGARAALVFIALTAPSSVLLAVYNTAAFGSPLRISYSYVTEQFAKEQSQGLFGVGVPDVRELIRILFSWDGLVVQSPVIVLAAVGLVFLWRQGARAEVAVCGAVVVLFLALSAGYYDPMGGISPGPRFVVPALPFLAVGLPCAFMRWPIVTLAATAISACLMIYRAGTWSRSVEQAFVTVWSLLGSPRFVGVLIVGVLALAALSLSALNLVAAGGGRRLPGPTRS
jgi:hypothetical protein